MSTVLITGGSGFLGRRLAVALRGRHRVVLAARNHKLNHAAEHFTGCPVIPMDVAHIEAVRDVFGEIRPEIVVHAAATKFVDLAERQPLECIDVNVVGSENVARVAIEKGVAAVVGISTDKAAPPVRNTYGLTKALMERMFCALDGKTATRFACVRYGNVAWSTGSVLPIWKRMHESTGVIGTTGPDMTRFFFTVDSAVALVLTALDHMEDVRGRVLGREMKSARIRDILDLWIKTRGGRWEPIAGRPGERTDEYLLGDAELPFTVERRFDGIRHFVISFNQRAAEPVAAGLSSATAVRLSEAEILDIIGSPPVEELK
ncbi:MAG: SDR family NAD(P)-dependent oxidoreductase [Candidatus Rokubacteria bacterium]|nr:SDR family NAD(P)-dependent oxidoreductase [Candidatus Rokubacteria bacterium]